MEEDLCCNLIAMYVSILLFLFSFVLILSGLGGRGYDVALPYFCQYTFKAASDQYQFNQKLPQRHDPSGIIKSLLIMSKQARICSTQCDKIMYHV